MRQLIIIQLFILFFIINIIAQKNNNTPAGSRVILGNEVLLSDSLQLISGKNIGIVTNHTGRLPSGIHIIDTLVKISSVNVNALYAPEHGIRGDAPAGDEITDGKDIKTGLPVYSLHGKTRKPTPEMLENVDLILFDIQDIGARFYTYIWTLYNVIESAIENEKEVIVLDRPNPINGLNVAGPIIDKKYFSFLGNAAIPMQHGMTVGELAILFNDILNSKLGKKCCMKVIKMKNWPRKLYFDECSIPWRPTSPNIPDLETALVYPGMCLFEATNISEGRGTNSPFIQIGSPWLNPKKIIAECKNLNIKGIKLTPVTFIPENIKGKAYNPKYKNELCSGLRITIENRDSLNSVDLGLALFYSINKVNPDKFTIIQENMNRLFGRSYLSEMLKSGKTPSQIKKMWQNNLQYFLKIRERYLLYL